MPILQNGQFSFTIPTEDLAKGLRPSRRNPRNVKYLTIAEGVVGYDNVLQVLGELTDDLVDTSAIAGLAFPYPQLFVFPNLIIIASQTGIYELVAGVVTLQLGGLAAGITWSAVAFNNHVYMSNGVVALIRNYADQVWATTTDLPIFSSIVDYNGQVMIGAPGVDQS